MKNINFQEMPEPAKSWMVSTLIGNNGGSDKFITEDGEMTIEEILSKDIESLPMDLQITIGSVLAGIAAACDDGIRIHKIMHLVSSTLILGGFVSLPNLFLEEQYTFHYPILLALYCSAIGLSCYHLSRLYEKRLSMKVFKKSFKFFDLPAFLIIFTMLCLIVF